jgi:hypothetical protein
MAEESWSRSWMSVQIDGVNPNTHYMEDIVLQLERSLGVAAPQGEPLSGGSISVGTDIEAQRVEIKNVTISSEQDSFSQAARMFNRIDRIANAVRDAAADRRVALIFIDSHTHDKRALKRFRASVWERHLAELTEVGLLLIDLGDPTRRSGDAWPPPPDLTIDLPERYAGESAVHAEEDLARIACDEGAFTTEAEARAFASTLLASSENVREMHARLARTLARLGPG